MAKPDIHLTACECGCGNLGDKRRMVQVRLVVAGSKPRKDGTRIARSWSVLPECEAPFLNEKKAQNGAILAARHSVGRPWWSRLLAARTVWILTRRELSRRQGKKTATTVAWARARAVWKGAVDAA